MGTRDFILRYSKTTKAKNCYKESNDQIGSIYVPFLLVDKLALGHEVLLQLSDSIDMLAESTGYVAKFVRYKKTVNKIRFKEVKKNSKGLGEVYINKKVVDEMGLGDEVIIRIPSHYQAQGSGGVGIGV